MMDRQVIVGVYDIGYEQVELVLREDSGAEFHWKPTKGNLPRITVGADHANWTSIVIRLLHEAMEMALARERARYQRSESTSNDSTGFVFMCDHPTFADCCARTGEFLASALPDLERAWKTWTKEKRCKSRKKS